ncbi:YezD family protein [Altererythrobacter sp. KTW20L]|jgi:hypothetical protein|uniref:YezD family protein n=1 Tax=Altererythrobacter sp. KTW20L TaxID=2942210 RepID=UPI0020BEE244|nr:YezD family protein [Altererythrobacter sp. KTW20L]MCL6251521.1 YezD family protein [Altererythrobacter sp. KTW20L]
MPQDDKRSGDPAAFLPEALGVVSDALSRLRYGAIQLTVHDGRVMQIDVTERKRLGD